MPAEKNLWCFSFRNLVNLDLDLKLELASNNVFSQKKFPPKFVSVCRLFGHAFAVFYDLENPEASCCMSFNPLYVALGFPLNRIQRGGEVRQVFAAFE
jgi:hypothetical protein